MVADLILVLASEAVHWKKTSQIPVSERQIIPVITCICIHIPPIYKINSVPLNGGGVVHSER